MPNIGDVTIGVEVDASGVPKQLEKQLDKKKFGDTGRGIGEAIGDGIGTTMKVGIGAAAVGIGATLTATLFAGFNRLTAIDNAKAKLDGLKFTTEQVTSVMASAKEAVLQTAFGLGEAASVAAIFGATGIKAGEDMTRALKLTADAATVGGTSMQDMGDIISEVSALGKVTGDTLNRMGDRGIDALSMIATQMGVNRDEARKMVSAGEIDFNEFAAAMEANIGGAALASGKTFQGAMANIMAATGRLGAEILEPVFNGMIAIAPKIIGVIDRITAAMAPIMDVIGPKIATTFEWIGAALDKIDFTQLTPLGMLSALEPQALADGFAKLLTAIVPIIDKIVATLAEVLPKMVAGLETNLPVLIVGIVGLITGLVPHITAAIPVLVSAFVGLIPALLGALQASIPSLVVFIPQIVDQLLAAIPAIVIALLGAVPTILDAALGLFEALVYAAVRIVPRVLQALLDMLPQVITVIMVMLPDIITAALELFSGLVAGLVEAIPLLIQAIIDMVPPIITTLIGMVPDLIAAAIELFSGLMTGLYEAIPLLLTTILSFLPDIIAAAMDLFMGLVLGLVEALPSIIAALLDILPKLLTALVTMIPALIEGAVTLFVGIVTGLTEALPLIITALIEAIPQLVTTLVDLIPLLIVGAVKLFTGIVLGLAQAIPAIIEAIVGLSKVLIPALIEMIPELLMAGEDLMWGLIAGITEMAPEILGAIVDLAVGLMEAFLDFFGIASPSTMFLDFGTDIIQGLIDGLASMAQALIDAIMLVIQPILDLISGALDALGVAFQWLYDNVIKPVWDGISSVISTAWEWIDKNVFTPFKTGIDLLAQGFELAKSAIEKTWEGIKAAVAVPINFVLETIWNKGIRSFWNGMIDALGLDKGLHLPYAPAVSFAKGGVLPGYTPGRDVHHFFSPTGGRLDLSGGEGIIRPDALRRLGGKKWLDTVNRGRGIGDGEGGNLVGDAIDVLADIGGAIWDFFSDPKAAIQKHIIDKFIGSQIGGQNIFGKTLGGIAAKTMLGFVKMFENAAPKVKAGAGMGWEAMWEIVKRFVPGATLNDALRPAGTRTAGGGYSYHGMGRAIDIGPANMATFNAVRALFPNATELIYTPAGNRQLPGGGWPAAVAAMHYDHIHLAMKKGGVFDKGGWLSAGGMGMNMTGKPEAVFTADQFAVLERNVGQMESLLSAVRGYRSPGLRGSSTAAETYETGKGSSLTIESGAFALSGPDPYKVSLLVVDRVAEKVGL